MSRQYAETASEAARRMVGRLAERPEVAEYRRLMTEIGAELAAVVRTKVAPEDRIVLICTNDDADFLAKGLLLELERRGCAHFTLACFWNGRSKIDGREVAPVLRSYIEPTIGVDAFVVVKSIISTACVVRTNITELVYSLEPRKVIVVAPVMFKGATAALAEEFDPAISRTFEYVWIAEDDERTDGLIVPGVGGSIYELLGVGDSSTKNAYVPELVRTRRAAFAQPSP